MQMSSNTSCYDLFAAWHERKKLPQFSEVLVWFKGTWLRRSEPSNHSHSLSVYQTTHGWLWLLKKTTSLQNHTSQFRFEFETFQLSGEKSSNSLFFSFCRRLNKNNVNEVSGSFCLTHLCVWLWGGGMVGPWWKHEQHAGRVSRP